MVGRKCVNNRWGYAGRTKNKSVEPLMPDRAKVSSKRDTVVYAVRGRSRFASGTRLLIRRGCASEPVTAEEDPTSLKKPKLESATRAGPDIG